MFVVPKALDENLTVGLCESSKLNGLKHLFFGVDLSGANSKHEFSLKGRIILRTYPNSKVKNSSGVIVVTPDHLIHCSKDRKKVVEMSDITDSSIVKEKELHLVKKQGNISFQLRKQESLLELCRITTVLSPLNDSFWECYSNIAATLEQFISTFEQRYGNKPINGYPDIIQNFIKKCINNLQTIMQSKTTEYDVNLLEHNLSNYIFRILYSQ